MGKILMMVCKKCKKVSTIFEFLDLPNKMAECPHCHHRVRLTEKQLEKLKIPR